ncbi:MAG: cation-translocating P-type ATPase [Deltaproteobacteria bacterium]|nr:cation-translocating P-type ATPase [Deltaproteobacteria bacterium]
MEENQEAEQPILHTLTGEAVLQVLESRPEGLTQEEALARLESHGYNELTAAKKISPIVIFFRQFKNLLILILLVATILSYSLGEHLDAAVILAIVLACVVLGFIQEYRAEKAAAALQKLAAPHAVVLRDNEEMEVEARELVPGDILLIHTGDRVGADARLLEATNLMADEAILTGESTPVAKSTDPSPSPDTAIADQHGMLFGGTVITYGRGEAVVTATGMETEFGRIAQMLHDVSTEQTPLERRVSLIGRVLSVICLAVAAGAVGLGILKGYGWLPMLIWGISLAVAAVPESLPAVVTGALAIGTTRMARKKAIVKRLPAVETMGCTTVICTDKTGTLTRNEMTVRQLYLDDRPVHVTGSGYDPQGEFRTADHERLTLTNPMLHLAARISLLCNDASLKHEDGRWHLRGDPTEGALLTLGLKTGLDYQLLLQEYPRVAEIPFDSQRKRMSTLHQDRSGFLMCLKGAPESLLPYCRRKLTLGGEKAMTEESREAILAENSRMARSALRVLGLAYRRLPELPDLTPESEETDLVWVGLVGMIDPARPEAREAVARCHRAGIKVIMITGDHPDTAAAIGRELGLTPRTGNPRGVLTGREVSGMDNAELAEALSHTTVFARSAPEHKLRLVELLKEQGEVVAMTGDGVNDAPALKRADIGVAMGITGTEVTKETASMILADDNFATLVTAVEEGRAIFDNIKKYLVFLLSCNLAEIIILTGAFFMGLPLPLIALQILWINLTTDGLPALALGVDPKSPDIMSRPPRPPDEGVFNFPVNTLLGVIAGYKTLVVIPLFAYFYLYNPHGEATPEALLVRAQTMVFVTLVLFELVNAFNCRAVTLSLFTVGILANRFLIAAVIFSLAMTVAVVEYDPLARLFHTVSLGWREWLLALGLSLTLVPVVEVTKFFLRRKRRGRGIRD